MKPFDIVILNEINRSKIFWFKIKKANKYFLNFIYILSEKLIRNSNSQIFSYKRVFLHLNLPIPFEKRFR